MPATESSTPLEPAPILAQRFIDVAKRLLAADREERRQARRYAGARVYASKIINNPDAAEPYATKQLDAYHTLLSLQKHIQFIGHDLVAAMELAEVDSTPVLRFMQAAADKNRCLAPNAESIWDDAEPILFRLMVRANLPAVVPTLGNQAKVKSEERDRAPKKRRRRTSPRGPRRMTPRQLEALRLIGEHKGNHARAAKEMGVSRQAFVSHLKAANAKLAEKAPKAEKIKTQQLPHDRRGQVAVVERAATR